MTHRILNQKQVCELTGLSRKTIWQLDRDKKFPKKISLTDGPRGRIGWHEQEVLDWIASRPRGFIGNPA